MTDTQYPEAKLWDMIEDIRVAMLTTRHGDRLESRPMHAYVDLEQHCLWFLTDLASEKTIEIAQAAPVNLAFVDKDDQSYISMTGRAHIVRDLAKQRQLWNAFAQAWMPQGPEGEDVGLIRVDPIDATYWDSPSSKLAVLWDVAKANLTKNPPSSSEVHKVTLG